MGYIFLGIPLILFVLFVLPIWLWLHYSNQSRGQLGSNEIQRLEQLAENARHMQERIKTLEEILDAEHPNWRQS
ncbi:envelope stress response membrane protein PspB [Xenorhabdus bovienii]|uniref:Envelope stress response membrane protein PspB n=7 Tax=Xenorhabdus bovienii TaxID=40576 RepID=A0A0B6XDI4_XENBV|nr:envelope stress response membrane protein PspB [Xenorhabdus bovienii]MCG3461830.1 envelope stress response membrane protein PspB [Xenorhabdus bovienii]MCG3472130.1 envelope stress response membrane protein PspB [Xenorhabdus bovienii]MDE1473571.1 envelope stress response membrane protein PspB [Xenorhabdus bovienii]MDE1477280.1 envelope stress response membrane protein PspB [Xenorhabdus bovienii]MDE1481451.1 envelope stress response membrane protein PspB [Xenorhabdus bovienii]